MPKAADQYTVQIYSIASLMKTTPCFDDTDTLYIEFTAAMAYETREFDENTLLDLDERGQLCAFTAERAS
jgi:uncharacterized protein YuzE